MRRPINWIVVCLSLLFLAAGTRGPRSEHRNSPRDAIITVIDEFGIPRTLRSAPELEGLAQRSLARPLPTAS
jgi:hypothetical protein